MASAEHAAVFHFRLPIIWGLEGDEGLLRREADGLFCLRQGSAEEDGEAEELEYLHNGGRFSVVNSHHGMKLPIA